MAEPITHADGTEDLEADALRKLAESHRELLALVEEDYAHGVSNGYWPDVKPILERARAVGELLTPEGRPLPVCPDNPERLDPPPEHSGGANWCDICGDCPRTCQVCSRERFDVEDCVCSECRAILDVEP